MICQPKFLSESLAIRSDDEIMRYYFYATNQSKLNSFFGSAFINLKISLQSTKTTYLLKNKNSRISKKILVKTILRKIYK